MSLPSAFAVDANVISFDHVDSTNVMAGRLLARWTDDDSVHLPETVLVAATQSTGRGRGANRWHSPVGGAYVTWFGEVTREQLAIAPLAAGVALVESIESVIGDARLGLKWPNDILAAGAKLAGLLCQSRVQPNRIFLVVGFGVNVVAAIGIHEAFALPAASLQDLGFTGTVGTAVRELVEGFVPRLRNVFAEPRHVAARWSARSVHRVGDELRVRTAEGAVTGTFVGFADDGRLLIEVANTLHRIAAGELVAPLPDGGG